MKRIKAFNRRELKFIIRTDQMQPFIDEITPFLNRDSNAGQARTYRVNSLYYDTEDYQAYWQKVEGEKHRRKLRIRIYGDQMVTPETECFVEIKERIEGSVRKRRIIVPYRDGQILCSQGYIDQRLVCEEDQPVIDEIAHMVMLFGMRPSCALRYDRMAFNGHPNYDPSLRITLDTNCRARIHDLDLSTTTSEEMTFFLSPQLCILELKADDRVPYWLVQILHRHKFTMRRISKYCTGLENLMGQLPHRSHRFPNGSRRRQRRFADHTKVRDYDRT
jgi:hypothetical protein